MSDAISAQGTTLEVDFNGGNSPYTYVTIPEVRSIGGPTETSAEIDVTSLNSTGGRKEYIQGFKDSSDCKVDMNYLSGDSNQQSFLAMYASGATGHALITYPDDSTVEFDFFAKERSLPANVGDALVCSVTMRITGAVTFSA